MPQMISVIIPTYNRQDTILKSVKSVLDQTIKDIEVIVVDDGSTDKTLSILHSIKDDRLKIVNQNHLGACAARNKGVEIAKGDYVAFHDSDDTCRPNRLKNELQCLEKNKADFICGNVLTHMGKKQFVSPNRKNGWLETQDDMFNITTMTFFAKKTVFKKYKFDPAMPRWQDLDLLLSICGKVKVYFCEEILCDYYREGDSMSLKPDKCISAYELIMKKYPNIAKNKGLLYSRLTKMVADSKVALGRSDYYEDYKNTFLSNKTAVNFVWLAVSRIGQAHLLYNYLHRH